MYDFSDSFRGGQVASSASVLGGGGDGGGTALHGRATETSLVCHPESQSALTEALLLLTTLLRLIYRARRWVSVRPATGRGGWGAATQSETIPLLTFLREYTAPVLGLHVGRPVRAGLGIRRSVASGPWSMVNGQ